MDNEHHPVVTLLLTRMETNPDEFLGSKWKSLLTELKNSATKEERHALDEKMRILTLDHIHKKVTLKLFGEEKEEEEEVTSAYENIPPILTREEAIALLEEERVNSKNSVHSAQSLNEYLRQQQQQQLYQHKYYQDQSVFLNQSVAQQQTPSLGAKIKKAWSGDGK